MFHSQYFSKFEDLRRVFLSDLSPVDRAAETTFLVHGIMLSRHMCSAGGRRVGLRQRVFVGLGD